MHSWQNGTRCRDGVNVFWCRSHLVQWFLSVSSLHALVFIQKAFQSPDFVPIPKSCAHKFNYVATGLNEA